MNTSRQYARKRKFEYPDEQHIPQYADEKYPKESTAFSSRKIEVETTYNMSFVSKNPDDPYLNMAEELIANGRIQEAMECLGNSITEYRNPYSIKRLGDLFQAALWLEYPKHGFTDDAGRYAQGAIGMYLVYVKLTGQVEVIKENYETLIQGFEHLQEFQLIFQETKDKVDALDEDEIINQFFN